MSEKKQVILPSDVKRPERGPRALPVNLFKRVILGLMAASALGFILVGPRQDAGLPHDRVIVDYWEKWVGTEADQMKQIVKDFNDTEGLKKGIFVRYLSMSGVDQKTLVSIAAGVPPDIAGLWDTQVAQFAAIDALEPLDDLAAKRGITEQTYLPAYWNVCRYNGHLWALVSTPAAVALHYNKQIFQENADKLRAAGCDPDRPPKTLDELDRYAQALDSRDRGGQIDRAGYVPLQSWYVAQTCYWFGGQIFDAGKQKFTLTSPECIRAYQWIQSYTARLGLRPMQDFNNGVGNFDSPQNPFLAGKLAMQQQGPWMANYIAHLKPSLSQLKVPFKDEFSLPRRTDNYAWAVAPFPSAAGAPENITWCSFDTLMIPRGARHKTEAFEFIAYVQRQEVMEKLCSLHCKNSPLSKVSKDFIEQHPNPYISVFQALAASPNAHGVPPVPIWPEIAKELGDAAQAVAMQGASPEGTLTAAQGRLQEKYDHFLKVQAERERLKLQ